MRTDFLAPDELRDLGLAAVGQDVRISRHALLFGAERIAIGDYTRIDAFCILSAGAGGISIGRNVHVSAYSAMLGQERIEIGDFATVSARCLLFSSSDDYSGARMANATIPDAYRGAVDAPVRVLRHALIAAGCILLPGVTIGESAGVAGASLVKQDVAPFVMVGGVPARPIGRRDPAHRALAEQMLQQERAGGTR
jgi:galactoside O-acetyltransferase